MNNDIVKQLDNIINTLDSLEYLQLLDKQLASAIYDKATILQKYLQDIELNEEE